MTEKTAKALYALLKELYQSRTAKEFVDVYEHERRPETQAVPVNWSVEKDNAYHDLTEAIFKRKPLLTIQKAATTFVDICNREERRKPEVSDVYQDIFGNRYIVIGINDEELTLIYFNARAELRSSEVFTVSLEDFLNPTFKKV